MRKIVSITHHTYFPDNDDLIKQLKSEGEFKFEFIPTIMYTIKTVDNVSISTLKPSRESLKSFSLYETGTSLSVLKEYFGPEFKKDELVLVKKAFQKLKSFASPCVERVIADLCCQIILETITKDDEGIYFIEKSATDKMLGRLGSLYLDLRNITICFLSYAPDDLMTTVMSSQTGKLHFDIHRLMSSVSYGKFGPYPGSSEDAIKQTYFYKHPSISEEFLPIPAEFLPIRFDIFAQGLSESDIEEKSEKIIKIFEDKSERLLHSVGKSYILLPIGFKHAKDAWEKELYKKEVIWKLLEEKKKRAENNLGG